MQINLSKKGHGISKQYPIFYRKLCYWPYAFCLCSNKIVLSYCMKLSKLVWVVSANTVLFYYARTVGLRQAIKFGVDHTADGVQRVGWYW